MGFFGRGTPAAPGHGHGPARATRACLLLAACCWLLCCFAARGRPGHTGIPSFDSVRVLAATSRIVNQHLAWLACTPFLMCVRQGPSGADDRPAPAPQSRSHSAPLPADGRAGGLSSISPGRGKREENLPAWAGREMLRWPRRWAFVGPSLALRWPFSSWGQAPATPSCLWLAQGPQAAQAA